MSVWLAVALVLIVGGGLAILSAAAAIADRGSARRSPPGSRFSPRPGKMTAVWHLGPIGGSELWWTLVTSPEVLVFLFFMITDPRTIPRPGAAAGPTRCRSACSRRPDRAVDERVLGEARGARVAHDRLRSTASSCSPQDASTPAASASGREAVHAARLAGLGSHGARRRRSRRGRRFAVAGRAAGTPSHSPLLVFRR